MTDASSTGPVVVFSASARPGLAQVRQLVAAGRRVRAVTRQRTLPAELRKVDVIAADLDHPPSLVAACEGADTVFFTSPSFAQRERAVEHIRRVGDAARAAGVRRVVYNTTSWHPDRPIGVPSLDRVLEKVEALRATGAPLTVVRPSLFMDNLLTRWVKPYLLDEGEFSYPHRPDLEVNWIALDDVARFMIAAAERDDCAGETLDVGGPEALHPGEVAERLSAVLGRPIRFRYITPREFGERMFGIFGAVSGMSREAYVDELDRQYTFKNEANTFRVEMGPLLERLPVHLTSMSRWLAEQNWTREESLVGSVSG